MEAEGRVRICHDASNRTHGASCCLPHFLAFYSAGADGTDEGDVRDEQSAQIWIYVCSPGVWRPPPGPCAPLCRPQAEDELF